MRPGAKCALRSKEHTEMRERKKILVKKINEHSRSVTNQFFFQT
jgi:hypothetical protein